MCENMFLLQQKFHPCTSLGTTESWNISNLEEIMPFKYVPLNSYRGKYVQNGEEWRFGVI